MTHPTRVLAAAVLICFAPCAIAEARSLEVSLNHEDGTTITLALADADFADPAFDGTVSFVGELHDTDGAVIPVTITMTVAELQALLPLSQLLGPGEVILATNPEMTSASIFEFEQGGELGESSEATILPLLHGATGSVSVAGSYADLQNLLPELGATPQFMATRMAHTLAMIMGFVPLAQDAPEAEPSFRDCYAAARDGCTRHCSNTGKTVYCIKDFNWSSAGGCSFECDTLEACCNAHP